MLLFAQRNTAHFPRAAPTIHPVQDWEERWRIVEARLVLGRHLPPETPTVAAEALAGGWDSPALRLLAGESELTPAPDVRDLTRRCVIELGRSLPDESEALLREVAVIATAISTGRVEEFEGCRQIALLGHGREFDDSDGRKVVTAFDYLDDEVQGRWGRTEPELRDAVRKLAARYS